MNAKRHPARARVAQIGTWLAVLVLASGCYSKVVDSRGIGGDSTELRKNHEFGSDNPLQDVISREKRRR